jgi:hypothetical protein
MIDEVRVISFPTRNAYICEQREYYWKLMKLNNVYSTCSWYHW